MAVTVTFVSLRSASTLSPRSASTSNLTRCHPPPTQQTQQLASPSVSSSASWASSHQTSSRRTNWLSRLHRPCPITRPPRTTRNHSPITKAKPWISCQGSAPEILNHMILWGSRQRYCRRTGVGMWLDTRGGLIKFPAPNPAASPATSKKCTHNQLANTSSSSQPPSTSNPKSPANSCPARPPRAVSMLKRAYSQKISGRKQRCPWKSRVRKRTSGCFTRD